MLRAVYNTLATIVLGSFAAVSALLSIGFLANTHSAGSRQTDMALGSLFLLMTAVLFVAIWRTWQSRKPRPVALGRGEYAISIGIQPNDVTVKAMRTVIQTHIHTLALERRRRLVADRYGVVDATAWAAEVDHFVNKVAMPFLVQTVPHRRLRRSARRMARQVRDQLPRANTLTVLQAALRSLIQSELDAFDRSQQPASIQASGYATPSEFEHWCANQLRCTGWNATVTAQAGDQGADVRAEKNGVILVVQCKFYNQPVGNSAVQEAFAAKAFYRAHIAAVVSTAGFTKAARALAVQSEVHLLIPEQLRTFHAQ